MASFHESEFSNRVNAAWRCFAKFKDILCSRSYPLQSRLKLFNAVVTPTALYACECWTMTSSLCNRLRTAWRKMVRKIFRVTRGELESWVDYIKRATEHVESKCALWGYESWEVMQAARKAKFRDAVSHDDPQKWSRRLLRWSPWFRCLPRRRPGRPHLRWGDSVAPHAE